ncbi:MAG: SRPBCC domain-containing protein [Bdellovibrionaceae bacterium]|nr:SRPBCC domain-containing protein [Pseudobdellovibrionaceae bacterium]
MAAKRKTNEIYIVRVYDAPVKAVWDAWADPAQAAKWWGPRGFTITTHSKDLRPGGHWSYTMHGPDGVNYENKTLYHEVETYSKMVYDHGGNDDRPPLFRVTVTFKENKGRTTMEMTMALDTAEAAEQTKKFIKQASGNSTWDRLAEFLDKETAGKERFVINRTFRTSPETMFKMWSEPEHFTKWLPPTGFTMKFLRADIRPGGSTFYKMQNDDGSVVMFGRTHYLEITKPSRLVYTQEFTDEKEKISRHPFAPLWPASMMTTVTISAETESETRVTVEWEPHGDTTAAEVAEFVKARAGMTQGWTGSFDKLEELLK